MATKYDAIVIGTGQAGPSLAVRLADTGMKVAIIERKRFGGTCVNTGCIPTKTLIASARTAHVARRAGDFGVKIDGAVRVDMPRVKARKDLVVAQSTGGVQKWLRGTSNVTVIEGHGRFQSARVVRVGDRQLTAPEIFINTGGRPTIPPVEGLAQIAYLTSSSMMDVDLEFAQMYRRFGSRVSVVEMAPRLIAREDEEVSQAVQSILENEGITVRLNAKCLAAERRGNDIAVQVSCEEDPRDIVGSHLL